VTQQEPGEMFVIRNDGNIVPALAMKAIRLPPKRDGIWLNRHRALGF
jgi:hypothetical protein